MTTTSVGWNGVFPAVTTQFREDFSLDLEASREVIKGLLSDGVSGLIIAGTVGENCSLSKAEKISLLEAAVDVTRGRVPVLAGIAEYTTDLASDMARCITGTTLYVDGGRTISAGIDHAE